jgi:NADPH:quinone reductase-like Zn-dependent oxidoreductase
MGIERFGGAVKALETADPRALRDGEALIEVKAAGVGNWDEIVRVGEWDVGERPPMALGVEAAGIVADVGPRLERSWLGAEVLTHPLPLAEQGTWAPWLIARTELLAHKPTGVSWTDAAAFPVPALTAVQVLDEALHLRPGERLLVNGAGSVTGGLIVSMAALRGVHVLATAGPSSIERVRGAGAEEVVDYHEATWPEQIVQATGGRGVDAAANAAQGGAMNALRAVRDGGRLATITSDPPPRERGIVVVSFYVRPDAAQLDAATRALAAGQLEFSVGARFRLAGADAALARAIKGSGGAVVVET